MKKNNTALEKNSKNHHKSSFFKKSKDISIEIWNDHDLWISALAVKGGATAVIVGSITVISYAVTLPFILPAIAVALCSGIIGIGIYGIAMGADKTWQELKNTYKRAISKNSDENDVNLNKKKEKKPAPKKTNKNSFLNKMLKRPLAQKILNSHIVKTVNNISEKQKKFFLAGMASTGSAFWLASSAITLITQVVLLPVIAASTIVTLSTVLPATIMLSATYGLYISIKPFFQLSKRKRDIKRRKSLKKKSTKKIDNVNKKLEIIKSDYDKDQLQQMPKIRLEFKKSNKNRVRIKEKAEAPHNKSKRACNNMKK